MAMSVKAQTIERDLQNARAKAQYSAFPELTRRYVKHNKDGIVLANTALLELAIVEAENAVSRTQKWTQAISLDDTPELITTSPKIKQASVQEAVDRLERVLSKGTEEHQEYAAIVLARTAMATDAPDRVQRVAHYLQNIQLPPAKIPTGYNFALVICGLTVKGMALEEEDRIPEAIVSYDNASILAQANPNERSDELHAWVENALYRASLLKMRQRDLIAATRSFRAYHGQALQWSPNFRLPRRSTIYQYYSQALLSSYKAFLSQSIATNGISSIIEYVPLNEQSQFYLPTLTQETAQIHAYWEDALYAVTQFPKADEKNWRALAMIEQIIEDRRLLGPGSDADKRTLVETIYRASQKTFQSPRILRFLFLALVDLGQYDEAVLALSSYLDMIKLNNKVKNASEGGELSNEQRSRQDVESERDIASVMVAGCRLYGKELKKPSEALLYAKEAFEIIEKHLQQEDAQELLSDVYKYQGIAYGLQASRAHEPELRPGLFSKAIESIEKAIEISPESFDTHYYHAYHLAETRDIPKAILAVKQSLNFNASHIPSWHLLTLLLSSQKDYERALNVCAVGLKESEWDLPNLDEFTASRQEGEEYLSLRITQMALQNQLYGPEAALEQQEVLFSLYTKVFAADPNAQGESVYDVRTISRGSHSELELTANGTIVMSGRPRASSVLSSRSRNGGGSDIGTMTAGGSNNTLEVPKANYAASVTSSIGSSGSRGRRSIPPPSATATHSTLGRSMLGLPPQVNRPTAKSIQQTAKANKILVTLWLMSASTFLKLGRVDDAIKAIGEAERVDASNPDVWYQLGLFHLSQEDAETASVSFSKALALEPFHVACLTRVGRNYLEAGSLEMAEGVLGSATKSQGWDSAEAWFYLGKVFEASDRLTRAKECLWYALDLESSRVDDLVMVNVRQIAEMGAYVELLEYNNIDGMILLSELSRRRIRSIQKLIRVGKNEVVVVLRVDKEKGYIDLSKRRVSATDIIKCEERYNKSKAVHSIMSTVAKKEDKDLEKLYEQLAWPLYAKYGHAYDAFKVALNEPEKVFEGLEIPESTKEELRRLTPQPVKIRADIEVTCFDYEGIDAIKTAFKEAEAVSLPDVPIRVKLVAPPLYVMITNALDKQLGIDTMEKAIAVLEESIKKSKGNMVTKMS
ncbi:hypothetical protein BGW38_007984, partial [Lunasporangiospora selenospora]